MKYMCHFTDPVHGMPNSFRASEKGISVFKDGFWLNDNMRLAAGEDAKYWIPPHRILYIEKVKE